MVWSERRRSKGRKRIKKGDEMRRGKENEGETKVTRIEERGKMEDEKRRNRK